MSRFRRVEVIEEPICHYTSPLFFTETSIVVPKTLTIPSFIEETLDLDLDLFPFDAVADLVRIDRTPSFSYRRVQKQVRTELCLQSLSDRVAELESRFDRLVTGKSGKGGDRKYTWTAEIKGAEKNGFDRKYKWVAEMVEEERKKKNIKWTAEIKGKGEESGNTRKYTFQVESRDDEKKAKQKEKEKVNGKKKGRGIRIVEIEEPSDHRDVVLRQVS